MARLFVSFFIHLNDLFRIYDCCCKAQFACPTFKVPSNVIQAPAETCKKFPEISQTILQTIASYCF